MTKNVCANTGCTCNHKGLSDIIDADQERKEALLTSRRELVQKIREIENDYAQRRNAILAPIFEALQRTDELLENLNRPACFGTMTCGDRDYEICSSMRVKACQCLHRRMA